MTSAAEIIDYLQLRRRLSPSLRHRSSGEFPPGWQSWLESIPARIGAISGSTADAIIGVFAQRPLASPAPAGNDLSRWQAFSTLWRQGWYAPEPEDRRWRWLAAGVTAVWHVVVSVMLVWLMYLQYLGMVVPPAGEESLVEVQYLGEGTEGGQGGGRSPPETPADAPAAASPAAKPASAVASSPPAQPAAAAPTTLAAETSPPQLEAALPEVAERDIPEPQIPPPPAQQPVVLSKPVDPQPPDFVLPPTRSAPELQARLPDLKVPDTSVPVAEVAEPLQPRRVELASQPSDAPTLSAKPLAVREREIAAPVEAPTIKAMQPEAIVVKALPVRTPTTREVRIPDPKVSEPAPTPAAAPTATAVASPTPTPGSTVTPAAAVPKQPSPTASAAATSASTPAASAPSSAASASSTAPQASSDSPGVGPKPTPAPGATASARRDDEWGDAPQQRPGAPSGGKPGLYNSDGSVRVGEAPGTASPGAPPGTHSDEITNLDRSGTWLKRKPVDYQPTRLDKFWMPHETLLQEWVRKGIKQVSIRIPGTSKRVVCVVSLLQLGGGCGISDPNLNEQPATARPPPDIPFKPHLQEDNGSVRPPPGTK